MWEKSRFAPTQSEFAGSFKCVSFLYFLPQYNCRGGNRSFCQLGITGSPTTSSPTSIIVFRQCHGSVCIRKFTNVSNTFWKRSEMYLQISRVIKYHLCKMTWMFIDCWSRFHSPQSLLPRAVWCAD